ncbi:MAG: hypothetical protein FJ278_10510 [Planctomycetes bacterium]|nr:hypothetical protein [Planctomycetota bacterium]
MDGCHATSGVEGQRVTAAEPNWTRWGVPLVCVALSLLMTYPYAFRPMAVSFLGHDSALFLWNCWWAKFALLDLGRSPFFCDYVFWPNGTSLALHSFALPYALVSIPFQLALGELTGCILAVRVVTLASFTLSAWLMYLLAKRLVGHGPPAFFAAIAVTFFPFRMIRMHLLHEMGVEFMALWVMAFLWLRERPGWRRAGALGACSGLLAYSSLEHALFMALLAGIYCLCALAFEGERPRVCEFMAWLAGAAVTAALVTAPILLPASRGKVYDEPIQQFQDTSKERSPALASFFAPNTLHSVWGKALRPWHPRVLGPYEGGARPEASVGWSLLFLALIGVIRGPRQAVRFWWISGLVFWVLMLGPRLRLTGHFHTDIPMPYAWLQALIPGLRLMREPLRMMPVLMLCLAMLAAYGLRRLATTRPRWLSAAFCGLLVLEYLSIPTFVGPMPVSRACARLAADTEDCAVLDIGQNAKLRLYCQIVHHKRLFGLDLTPIPRASRGALAFWESSPSVQWLLDPDGLLKLPSDVRARILAENHRIFRQVRLKYVVLHTRAAALKGSYWDGMALDMEAMAPARAASHDAVLRLHQPVEVFEDAGVIVYRFW